MFDKADSSFTSSCSQQSQSCRRGASSSLKLWDPLHLMGKCVFPRTDPKENIVKKRQLKIQALDLSFAIVNSQKPSLQKDSCHPAFLCHRTNCSREGTGVDVAHCHIVLF